MEASKDSKIVEFGEIEEGSEGLLKVISLNLLA
jgi:hypothetical protein